MRNKFTALLFVLLTSIVQAASSYAVGWTPLLGMISSKPASAKDFHRVVNQYWDYPIRVNFILRGVDYDIDRPEYSVRTIDTCRELLELGRVAHLFHGQKNTFDEISQSEILRYFYTCKAYRRTVKMQPSTKHKDISAKTVVEFLINDYIEPGDGTFLDAMAKARKITAVDSTRALVQSDDGSIYIIRKISWGDYDGDGYEDVHFVVVQTDKKKGVAIGLTLSFDAKGKIVMKEAW